MNLKLFLLLILITTKSFSQEKKFSVELSYPFTGELIYLNEKNIGIADLGLTYRFLQVGVINIGGSFNASFAKNKQLNARYHTKVFLYQPRIFAEVTTLKNFHPTLGVGYSIIAYKGKPSPETAEIIQEPNPNISDITDINDDHGSFNVNIAIAYDVSKKLFLKFQYDYFLLKKDDLLFEEVTPSKGDKSRNVLKLGFGLKF